MFTNWIRYFQGMESHVIKKFLSQHETKILNMNKILGNVLL